MKPLRDYVAMYSTVLTIVCTAQLVAAYVDVQSVIGAPPKLGMPGSYLIALHSDSQRSQNLISPHEKLYQELRLLGVNWTTTQEYSDRALTGAVVELSNDSDVKKLAQVTGIESVVPLRYHPGPETITATSVNISRRDSPVGSPWSHIVTGVNRLHRKRYTGKGVKIGIIGTGIDYTHPAFGGKIGPTNKIIGGYDFVGNAYTGENNGPSVQPSEYPLDICNGHGTMVAGVIGATPGITRGIMGVAYEASLSIYRVFGCKGGTSDAIMMNAMLRAEKDGNSVILVSAGVSGEWGTSAAAFVARRLVKSGVIVILGVGGDSWNNGYWQSWDLGDRFGLISVGSAFRVGSSTQVHDASGSIDNLGIAANSLYGPSSDLYMTPALLAPGANILTTIPVASGSGTMSSDPSLAAAFVAGSAALWLQSRGNPPKSSKAVRSAFQNTAIPLRRHPRGGRTLDTAARQGAGLIHVYNAVHSTGGIQPTELLLNDTANFRRRMTIRLRNTSKHKVRYTLTHVPAGMAPTMNGVESFGLVALLPNPLTVQFSPITQTIPARSVRSFDILFAFSSHVDHKAFPVYSGYVKAAGTDGSVYRSPYLGLAGFLREMKIIDTTDALFGAKLPVITDGDFKIIYEPRTFSMEGNDRPLIHYRLLGPTRVLRLDLIDAGVYIPVTRRDVIEDTNRLATRSLSRLARRKLGVRGWLDRSQVDRGNKYAGARILGTIFVATHAVRHPNPRADFPWRSCAEREVGHLADGRPIPDGRYKLLLRALKMTGNPRKEWDWEVWASPSITIKRLSPTGNQA